MWYMPLVETNLIPEFLLRVGARVQIKRGLRERYADSERHAKKRALIQQLANGAIAMHADAANEQHYELPPEFFETFLGPHMKYSAGYWPRGIHTLDGAEEAMLRLTVERARVQDGQRILDLGCGWGALSLYIAEHFPNAQIVAVSNSEEQRKHIMKRAVEHGYENIEAHTADINTMDFDRRFDRVLSVEMFEHMRNYEALMSKIAGWLKPGGLLFVHHFSHAEFIYLFNHADEDDWMARHFFTGGTMPSHDMLNAFTDELWMVHRWWINGTHYRRTLEAWRTRYIRKMAAIKPILRKVYGSEARQWQANWKLFFIACSETFGMNEGSEWGITHVLFEKPTRAERRRERADDEQGFIGSLVQGFRRFVGGSDDS
jgi:cyclopropane fatty-acyl-phospholipid synthase-like methyltransferase